MMRTDLPLSGPLSRPLWMLLFLLAPSLAPSLAPATPERLGVWSDYYPDSTLAQRLSCNLCHTSTAFPVQWNPYGTAIRQHPLGGSIQNLPTVFLSIEPLDSDGDGYANIAEIRANTAPGDATERPTSGHPGQALSPAPPDGATDQPRNVTLTWDAGDRAESYIVLLGAGDSADVLTTQSQQTEQTFAPADLVGNTQYVWRVDSVAEGLRTEGALWTFTTVASVPRPRVDNPFPDPIVAGSVVIHLEPVMEGLVSPLGVVPAGDGSGRRFIYDQTGIVYVLQADGVTSGVFFDAGSRLVSLNSGYDERGLLGFVTAPDFAQSGRVYTYTSDRVSGPADFSTVPALDSYNHQSVVREWTVSAEDPNVVDPESARELLRIDQPQSNHNGGTLLFGPDGLLYITVGDGGSADDQGPGHSPEGNGQDLSNVLGTVLRIDPQGDNSANGQYGIPADNPFVGADGLDEIFVYGLRNAFRFSFEPGTGRLILADVGQNHIEAVYVASAGDNCGWPIKEGSFYFEQNEDRSGYTTNEPPPGGAPEGLLDPVAEYDHDEGISIIGGFVYEGAAIGGLQGRYVFSDFGTSWTSPSGRLFHADLATGEIVEFVIGEQNLPLGLWVKGMGMDDNGDIYVCASSRLGPAGQEGVVLKIVGAGAATGASQWVLY